MQTQQVHTLIQQQIESLSQALEAGRSEMLTAVLNTMARFHRYSLGNILLILFQRPSATRVAGFQTWKSLKRNVRKGEKGIAILAPMLVKAPVNAERQPPFTTEEMEGTSSDTTGESTQEKLLRFRVVYVFDISQTEGEDLPALTSIQGDPGAYTDRLKTLVQQLSITLDYADNLGGADGVSKNGAIVLRAGLCPAEEFSVLVHELAHELLHHAENRSAKPKTVRETEAEAVAFVVGQAIGLDMGTASSEYIQLYRGDAQLLNQSLEAISKTAGRILTALYE
ncbi:MAG: ArdC family protein [Armatimonadota bacterium]